MKKVLITGASGFIGSHTIEFLLEKDYKIHAFSSQKRENTEKITWHQVDIAQTEDFSELIKKISPTHLLHLAWDVTPEVYMESESNYDWCNASKKLIEAFYSCGGKRFVVAGTQFETNNESLYASCKRELLTFLENSENNFAWGRIFYLFGENENPKRLVPYVINSLKNDKQVVIKDGEQIRDFMYVKDVAKAFVEILDCNAKGVFDIGLGEGIKIKDLAMKIADKINKPHLVTIKKSENKVQSVIADIAKLRDEVGFKAQYTLDEAIGKII